MKLTIHIQYIHIYYYKRTIYWLYKYTIKNQLPFIILYMAIVPLISYHLYASNQKN